MQSDTAAARRNGSEAEESRAVGAGSQGTDETHWNAGEGRAACSAPGGGLTASVETVSCLKCMSAMSDARGIVEIDPRGMPRRKGWGRKKVSDYGRINTWLNSGTLIVGILTFVVGTGVGVTWWEPLRTLLRVGISPEAAAYNRVREALRETREELAAVNDQLADSRESLEYSERHVELVSTFQFPSTTSASLWTVGYQ